MDGVAPELTRFEDENCRRISASIPGRKVALVAYRGWDNIEVLSHDGRNAEANESTVLYVQKKRLEKNPPMELMITAMMHKTDDSDWTTEELNPVQDIEVQDITRSGSALGAIITLYSGEKVEVDFRDIDGKRTC